ncbi:hypothetical protein [Alcanivorax sp. 1008]|uniref:hypothetical protein n=1 Tax=Alcanivorax sp. 1008 TaxID=2816853 RepID=UPI001D8B3D6E|nr:hypothetical protein [Alcanivorax sp. 1008]MCC1496728.1 hypothetical protein [Alcanivorax sp. 1008]
MNYKLVFALTALLTMPSISMATCGVSSYEYASQVAKSYQMDKPQSLLSKCGIGGLINLEFLGGIDLLGALKDFIEKGVCGAVESAVSVVRDPINERIGEANDSVRETDRAMNNMVRETFDDKYLPFGGKSGDGSIGNDTDWKGLYDRVVQ